MWRSEDIFVEFVFSLSFHVDFGDQTQAMRFVSSSCKLLLVTVPQFKGKFEASIN